MKVSVQVCTCLMLASLAACSAERQVAPVEHQASGSAGEPATSIAAQPQAPAEPTEEAGIAQGGGMAVANEVTCVTPSGAGDCVNVVRFADPNEHLEGFNQALARAQESGKVTGCSTLIDLPAGTASGNHSFGGACML